MSMLQKRYDDNFKYIEKRTFCNFFVAESYFLWYNQFVKKNWAKPSKIKGFSPVLFRTGETMRLDKKDAKKKT